jgi:hypothetical protein
MKTVGEMNGAVRVAEHLNRRERDAVAHRLRIISNDVLRRSGGSLLDGRIDDDRCEGNALYRPPDFVVADRIHGGSFASGK